MTLTCLWYFKWLKKVQKLNGVIKSWEL